MDINNENISYALNYHELTKHTKKGNEYTLDWNNKPLKFKFYKELPSISLPIIFHYPKKETMDTLNDNFSEFSENEKIDKKLLAQILFFSYGINRKIKTDYGICFMRTASATGALYPNELYLSCVGVNGIKDGLYHYCPGTFTLSPIRYGDYRFALYKQTGNKDFIFTQLILIVTSVVYRNAWKYHNRSYRHLFWDSGVLVSNLLAVCSANSLSVKIFMGFVDTDVNRLLCLTNDELVICLITVGNSFIKSIKRSNIKSVNHPIIESCLEYPVYPEILKIHNTSSLLSVMDVKKWIKSGIDFLTNKEENNIKTNSKKYNVKFQKTLKTTIDNTILLRGSTRRFSNKSIPYQKLCNILYVSLNSIPFDFMKGNTSLIDVYFIVNNVQNISSGGYYYNKTKRCIECLKNNVLYGDSGYLCLSQQLFNDASVVFFLMANLNNVLSILGNRGYRCCQFEAGIIAGKIYLSSYSQGLGASGATFYDDPVIDFFAPYANYKNTMIALGIGVPDYISKKGKVLSGSLAKSDLLNSI